MTITKAFARLAERHMFVVAQRKAPGVVTCPVDAFELFKVDGQTTSHYTPDVAEALALDAGSAYGVGIVLTGAQCIVCVDIDHCIGSDGMPSALAQDIVARFPGAYVERSQSGDGLHVFFAYRAGQLLPHGSKNGALHIEMYHELRFVFVTGHGAGDPLIDGTDAANTLITQFFPKAKAVELEAEWTEEPVCADYAGSDNDDELIEKFLNARGGAQSIFGNKATIQQLWNGSDELGKFYAPNKLNETYDGSQADMALASHLVFWTGGNLERVERLMLRSPLHDARAWKWDSRPGYLRTTIAKTAGGERSYYVRQRSAPVAAPLQSVAVPAPQAALVEINTQGGVVIPPAPTTAPVAAPAAVDIGDFVLVAGQQELFAGCTYVEDLHEILLPAPFSYSLPKERFDVKFGGRHFQTSADTQKATKSAWEAFVSNELYSFPKVRGLFFAPDQPSGATIERDGLLFANSYVPLNIEMREGNALPFLNHIKKLYPNGNDALIIVSYLAAMVQYKGIKAAWCLFLQGVEGNGKSFISVAMEYCLGQRYTHHAKASELGSRFNSALYGKLFITIEDIYFAADRNEIWESLKPMITNTRLEFEGKGVDKVTREATFNFILNSNHKDGIRKTENDRRIAPFYAAQQEKTDLLRDGLNTEYFNELWGWFDSGGNGEILYFLSTAQIPDVYNFAKECRRAPDTTSTVESIDQSRGAVEQEIGNAIESGRVGFRGDWIASTSMDELLIEVGKARVVPRNKRKAMLIGMGYELHRALTDGRVNSPTFDQKKPSLYVKRGTVAAALTHPQAVVDAYNAAQQVAAPAPITR